MVFTCVLCEKEVCYVTKFCDKCRRIKHLLNIYSNDVYEVLEKCLVRNEKQQNYKVVEFKTNKNGLETIIEEEHGDETYNKPPKTFTQVIDELNKKRCKEILTKKD